jgi:two-component system, chemotaxis family, protein-glutamate methylesterase/glutaminase
MITVVIVDDSAFMRQIFKKTINEEKDMKVIATARDGEEALKIIHELKPDVLTLDIEMPIKNGLETLQEIMHLDYYIPVIMISALSNSDTVMKALDLGAFDFIPKPSGSISLNIDDIIDDLKRKIRAAVNSKKKPQKTGNIKPYQKKLLNIHKENYPIIAIGTSSGGPKALKEILPVFPENIPAAFLIVQHMPAGFTKSLANRLNQESLILVKEAKEGDYLRPGEALIAPGNYHLLVNNSGQITLNQKAKKWGVRPCTDYMMSSLARIYKERTIGVILTGMGHDGVIGMQNIKKYNGYGIVEDKSTALVYGMPGSTIKAKAYDKIIPLNLIPFEIINQIEGRK